MGRLRLFELSARSYQYPGGLDCISKPNSQCAPPFSSLTVLGAPPSPAQTQRARYPPRRAGLGQAHRRPAAGTPGLAEGRGPEEGGLPAAQAALPVRREPGDVGTRGCPRPRHTCPAAGQGGDSGRGPRLWPHRRISPSHQIRTSCSPLGDSGRVQGGDGGSREWAGVCARGMALPQWELQPGARTPSPAPTSQLYLTLVKNWQSGTKGPAWNSKAVTRSPSPHPGARSVTSCSGP